MKAMYEMNFVHGFSLSVMIFEWQIVRGQYNRVLALGKGSDVFFFFGNGLCAFCSLELCGLHSGCFGEAGMGIRWVTSLLSLLIVITIMVKAGLPWNMYSSFTKRVDADVQYQNLMHVSRELFQCFYTCAEDCRKEFGGTW